MSLTLEHLATGTFTIPIRSDAQTAVRNLLDIRTGGTRGGNAFARVIVTDKPVGITPTIAAVEAAGIYAGVLMGFTDNREAIHGYGLAYCLGEDDGGVLWSDVAYTQTGWTAEAHIDEWVLGGTGVDRGNGIRKGNINTSGTTMSVKLNPGQTPRQTLANICQRRGWEWTVSPDRKLHVDTGATLFDSGRTLLTHRGGWDGNVSGVAADLSLDGSSAEPFVTKQWVDWNGDGTSPGSATNTVPTTYDAPDGGAWQWHNWQGGSQRYKLRDDEDVDKIAAWLNNNQTAASNAAAQQATNRATWRETITAEIYDHNPTRFMVPGDWVYVYDQSLGLVDTSNAVRYRGETVHPRLERVVSMDVPCDGRFGYYLIVGNSTVYDFRSAVMPEDQGCVVELGRRGRFVRRRGRPKRTNRKANRHRARVMAYLARRR